ncbi:MAG: hypothetical protein QXR22_01045 [Acidilobaceae archaeon]
MNSIDSIISAIGVNIGTYREDLDPLVMSLAIIGGGLAFGLMSGFVGTFLSERAERIREFKEIEKAIGRSLKSSIYGKVTVIVPVYVALMSSIGVIIFPTMLAAIYLLAYSNIISVGMAYTLTNIMSILILLILGAYMAKISGENILKSALRVAALGLGAIIIVTIIKSLTIKILMP